MHAVLWDLRGFNQLKMVLCRVEISCTINGWKAIYRWLPNALYATRPADQSSDYRIGDVCGAGLVSIPLVGEVLSNIVL